MNRVKGMFEDFTSVSCALCKKVCGQKNCLVHRKDCFKRNLFTAKELVKKGWVKREDAEEVMDYILISSEDRDALLKATADSDMNAVKVIVERLKKEKEQWT